MTPERESARADATVEPKTLRFPITLDNGEVSFFVGHVVPARGPRRGWLQVLVHGNSYDHRYWDAPVLNGEDYSYTGYMTAHGYDVVAIDLPGVGDSGRPDGHAVNLRATGEALGNAIASLRTGTDLFVDGRSPHIALIGHSMGAAISVFSHARWPVADALVVTGTGFTPERPRSAWAPGAREALLSEPYALVAPEGRVKFYHLDQADPDVIDFDNRVLRTAAPSGLWADCITLQDDPTAGFAEVEGPVLLQLGEHDPIIPSAYAEAEARGYARAQVSVDRLPGTGHSFNLHRNRTRGWEGIDAFLRTTET